MKNRMTGASFGISFETAVLPAGGASEPAPAAPAAAPAPAPAVDPAPAPAPIAAAPTKTGFFAGLKRAGDAPAPAAEPAAKVQVLSDDKSKVLFEGSQADAEAYVKANATPAPAAAAPAPASVVPADALAKPFLGRSDITTLSAAEDLYRKSQTEALRLHDRSKALEAAVAQSKVDAEARIAAITAELDLARKTPAFVEMQEKELEALFKENPYQANKYVEAKKAREQAVHSAKEQAERAVREKHDAVQKGAKQAMANWDAMSKDPKTYPKFTELTGEIDAIYNGLDANQKSQLDSNPEGPALLYERALGRVYKELLAKGSEVKTDAAEQARLKAESDAASARVARGEPAANAADTRTPQQKSDAEWRANREKARQQNPGTRIFRDRVKT